MKIGIIGAGNIGGTLTRRLSWLGHQVSVANSRHPETLVDLATETGAVAVRAEEAADSAQVVIISIPERNVRDLPKGFLDGAEGYYFARLHGIYEFLCVAKTAELKLQKGERQSEK